MFICLTLSYLIERCYCVYVERWLGFLVSNEGKSLRTIRSLGLE